eukprot:tig00021521_g22087.t1
MISGKPSEREGCILAPPRRNQDSMHQYVENPDKAGHYGGYGGYGQGNPGQDLTSSPYGGTSQRPSRKKQSGISDYGDTGQ